MFTINEEEVDVMISKKIHYCWFGKKELPPKVISCIDSWKKYCPDYEIIEWNEDNYDVFQNAYTSYVYDSKKFAFLSDYARLQIIYQEGGIYLDTDVEVIRSLDELLLHKAFFGFETKQYINTGIGFGAEKNNPVIFRLLDEYKILMDGNHGTIGCPILNTNALLKLGLVQNGEKQIVEGAVIYPIEYFNPYDDPTGRLNLTNNTYSIHWYTKTWMSKRKIVRSKVMKPIHRLLGTNILKRRK